jgi:uncharacterized membrane protein
LFREQWTKLSPPPQGGIDSVIDANNPCDSCTHEPHIMSITMTDKPSRILEIDFGRGLAVFLMMIVHTLWMYGDTATQSNSWLGITIHIMGKGTAAFLVAMGISVIISKPQTLYVSLKRSVFLLLLAYWMNFLKFIVPIEVFGSMPENFIAAYGLTSPLTFPQLRYIFLTGDILQMAAISFFIISLLKLLINNKFIYLAIAFFITLSSKFVSGYQPGIAGLDYVAKLFFSDHYQVYFPVFPWMSFILFGMFLGQIMQEHKEDKKYMFAKLPMIAAISLVIGGGLCALDFEYHFGNFFHLGPGGVLYLLGINSALLWGVHKIVQSGYTSLFTRFLYFCSKHVTSLYIIQWTIICWGMGILGYQQLGTWQVIAAIPIVIAISLLVQKTKDQVSHWYLKQKTLSSLSPIKNEG